MHCLAVVALLSFLKDVHGAPSAHSQSYAVKEEHVVPRGWTAVSRAPVSHLINLQIGLKQTNQDVLEQHAVEVTDPSHARYGQYLSAEEVNELIAPSQDTLDSVYSWLAKHEITTATLSPTKDWISVALPVEKVEELLRTEYSLFQHVDGSVLIRAPVWSLPEHLHDHIDVIQPTTSFFRVSKEAIDCKPDGASITWHNEEWGKGSSHQVSDEKPKMAKQASS